MSVSKGRYLAATVVMTAMAGGQLSPASALADPEPQPQPVVAPQPEQDLRNVTYRARVDGMARDATIAYLAEGGQTQTATPTMIPGRTFEANTVLSAAQMPNLRVSVGWPYSANLHCEILVDDQVVSQADDFVAPRIKPDRADPDYGALTCEAPLSNATGPAPPAEVAPTPS